MPNFMLLSSNENLWPFLTLRAPTTLSKEKLPVMVEPRYVNWFVVVDGDDWRCLCVLFQDVRLLQADGPPEVLAGLREASITGRSSCWVWVATAASTQTTITRATDDP